MTNNKKAKKQTTKQKKFKFIDLFAGVGGIRIPFEELGGKCVFTSEWDKFSQITYEANFGEKPHGDITQIDEKDIPKHNLLLAGFPCQAFSELRPGRSRQSRRRTTRVRGATS